MTTYMPENNSKNIKMSSPEQKYSADSSHAITPPRTPTATTTSAHRLFVEIQEVHTTLSALSSLAPGGQVDELLTRLVGLCIETHSADFISNFFSIRGISDLCSSLRPLCGAAEGELEKYWANRIIQEANKQQNTTPKNLLASFPYHQNYIDLSNLEMSTLSAYLPIDTPQYIAFIGSGPLPLTSLCMLDRYPSSTVHNIDRDATALATSQELCSKLGYSGMTFSCEDITSDKATETKWEDFDVVFLAALVGCDTESKISILASLSRKLKAGTLVVARSAKGLREVLYPVLELSSALEKQSGLEILVEVHPWTKVVNSVVVMRVKE